MSLSIKVNSLNDHKQIDNRWAEIRVQDPFSARSYFASAVQAGSIYVHGGYDSEKGIMADMYSLHLEEEQPHWKAIEQEGDLPGNLRNHTLTAYMSDLILYGGQKNMIENNPHLYRFDLRREKWVKCKLQFDQTFDYALDSHGAVCSKNHLYVFCGYDAHTTEYQNFMLKINLEHIKTNTITATVIKLHSGPSPRANFGFCSIEKAIYLFGGNNGENIYDDFWRFSFDEEKWCEITKNHFWPHERKGACLVPHAQSKCIFMFGGIKEITKERNDVCIFELTNQKWVKIHSNTNDIYEPSPTIKDQPENSPTILAAKRKKKQKNAFQLGLKSISCYGGLKGIAENEEEKHNYSKSNYRNHTAHSHFHTEKKMSVVQEKKYRQFLQKKKKLLNEIGKAQKTMTAQRKHSPTSQALKYSLNEIGEQKRGTTSFEVPKVIYDKEKGYVIGKKPCARDGHAGLLIDEKMVIIGGDRHMVSFNDLYIFKMDKAIKGMHFYEES